MGRGNGKLKQYLKDGLDNNWFPNLKYESEEVFNFELPRYDKKKILPYEKILINWYKVTGKVEKYPGYSDAKAVFKAALKNSIFLIPLETVGSKLRFRFATEEEKNEKKKAKKIKGMKVINDEACIEMKVENEAWIESDSNVSSPPEPPSVSSSGYYSCGDECDDVMADPHETSLEYNRELDNQVLPTLSYEEDKMIYDKDVPKVLFDDESNSKNQSHYQLPQDLDGLKKLWDLDGEHSYCFQSSMLNKASSDGSSDEAFQNIPLNEAFQNIPLNEAIGNISNDEAFQNIPLNEATSNISSDEAFQNILLNEATCNISSDEAFQNIILNEATGNISSDGAFQNIALDVVQHPSESGGLLSNVDEVKLPLVVDSQGPKQTYWLCTQKQKIGAILMLVYEKQDIEAGNQQILAGSLCFPGDTWEPGVSYNLQKEFELNGMYFCFYICNKV